MVDWSGGVHTGEFWVELYCMTHGISFPGVGPSSVKKCAEGFAVFMQLLVCVYTCVCMCVCVRHKERESP